MERVPVFCSYSNAYTGNIPAYIWSYIILSLSRMAFGNENGIEIEIEWRKFAHNRNWDRIFYWHTTKQIYNECETIKYNT